MLVGPEQLLHLPQARTGPVTAPDGVAAAGQPMLSFGGLLRQLRTQARLTQEELAEAARLSPRSVSDLERGISRTARKGTAVLLAEALSLTGPVHELFVAAARGRAPVAEVLAGRSLSAPGAFTSAVPTGQPRDIVTVTGRQAELEHLLEMLTRAVAGGVVVVIHATPEPVQGVSADSARPAPRSFHKAAPVCGGHLHWPRKRRLPFPAQPAGPPRQLDG
jgi:transcriptional regulator with XRE-family HTH domain